MTDLADLSADQLHDLRSMVSEEVIIGVRRGAGREQLRELARVVSRIDRQLDSAPRDGLQARQRIAARGATARWNQRPRDGGGNFSPR